VTQVRCAHCHARLFDTTGRAASGQRVGVEIRIKCWRCGRICVVRVVGDDGRE
jgi:ribosomal protein S27E